MNGSAYGSVSTAAKPNHDAGNNSSNADLLSRIRQALEVVHSPYSSNDSRKEASIFLEEVKSNEEAPYHGFTLARDQSQEAVVRHYSLSLLEHGIKRHWQNYSINQQVALRRWVLELSQNVSGRDPTYLQNKTAQLWVEVAKRSWGGEEWLDMDTLLVQLWTVSESLVHKSFVLTVLETLSEEVFGGDDAAVVLRETALKKALLEIFTPIAVLDKHFPKRQSAVALRFGEEGWLHRLGTFINQALRNEVVNNEEYRACAVKTVAVYRSAVTWVGVWAIAETNVVEVLIRCLSTSHVPLQMVTIDAMYAVYAARRLDDNEFKLIVSPLCKPESVKLLRNIYEWFLVDPNDIDDEKYQVLKKFSEMISVLGNCVEDKYPDIPQDLNFADILGLLLTIVQNQSLVVSIPVLVTWSRMLRVETMSEDPALPPLVAPLLEVCSSRLIRYENLPEDFDDPSMIFLLDDIDTIPERHAFLGNYRRYSISVIESIVHEFQNAAIPYILNRAGNLLGNLYVESGPFQAETYSKSSLQLLKVEAQFSVVEAAVKQYMKWRDTPRMNEGTPGTLARERATLENLFQTWCNQLLEMRFEDPLIRKKALQLAVAISTSALDTKAGFMLRVLEHILTTQMPERPEHQAYSDAVKELQIESVNDLRRLAIKIPDQVFAVYDQLAAKVDEITQAGVDPKQALGYQSFLFTIIHRTSSLDIPARVQRLQPFIDPVKQAWQNAELDAALSSFTNFCDALYVTKCRDYIVQHRVHEVSDWSKLPLDDNGQAIQAELNDRIRALPLRMSKGFLGCSTEKVKKDSPPYEVSCRLWHDAVPLILPNLLKFLSHAHAFHNPANWAGLPSEMSPIVGRILTDRFWQAGISEGSKDDFYARVVGTKSTMEGLASSIRASVRAVRDSCYSIIFCLSRLERYFYGFAELPGPLAHAIFADAHCLSSHQLINLLNLVKYLIDECPVDLRNHFMPPLLAACFTQLDAKISSEWEKLDQKLRASAQDDDLTEEMKEESSLRQLTHSAVILVAAVLDPMPARSEYDEEPKEPMRRFCLSNSSILEPLILFSTHAIRMRDTRCCSVVLRIFRSLIPEFRKPDSQSSSIREFISNDVLKACISSLHEPYFVDLHKELATLIASILTHYCPLTETPRQVLLALPGIHEKSVNKCIDYVSRPAMQNRQQAALVLDLLRDLKGVSISEQGRITKSGGVVRKELSKMQKEFMKTNLKEEPLRKEPSPDLEGVAGMFDT